LLLAVAKIVISPYACFFIEDEKINDPTVSKCLSDLLLLSVMEAGIRHHLFPMNKK